MVQIINYYTGIVFRGFTYGVGYHVLSGGRYDNLIQRFGKDCPATGFSLGINMIMTALERQGKLPAPPQVGYHVIYHKDARKKAFSVLNELRQKGDSREWILLQWILKELKCMRKIRV